MPECKCGNCQNYDTEIEECNIFEELMPPTSWCLQHRMDWDKERGVYDNEETSNERK